MAVNIDTLRDALSSCYLGEAALWEKELKEALDELEESRKELESSVGCEWMHACVDAEEKAHGLEMALSEVRKELVNSNRGAEKLNKVVHLAIDESIKLKRELEIAKNPLRTCYACGRYINRWNPLKKYKT